MANNIFNYSKFHYFDKNGHELMLNKKYGLSYIIQNTNHPDSVSKYGFVTNTPAEKASTHVWFGQNVSMETIEIGERYPLKPGTESVNTTSTRPNGSTRSGKIYNPIYEDIKPLSVGSYTSSSGTQYYPIVEFDSLSDESKGIFIGETHYMNANLGFSLEDYIFPSMTFTGSMSFDKVSTGLVETQRLFVLVDNPLSINQIGTSNYTTTKELADASINKTYEFSNKTSTFVTGVKVSKGDIYNVSVNRDPMTTATNQINVRIYDQNNPASKSYEFVGCLANKYSGGQTFECPIDIDNAVVQIFPSTNTHGTITLQHIYKYAENTAEYINRYKLFFFIDCRTQKDFRFFTLDNDNLVWSDRVFMDLNLGLNDSSTGNGYAVNIGFCGENEGYYEQSMYVCLLDTSTSDSSNNYPGDVYPIGEIKLSAETEGEDERYRTLFTNFGIPDPITYDEIFKDSDRHSENIDYMSINRHSKEMFLSYSEIFPYVGSYKALLNALKVFGYDDIFFKEWYKEMDQKTKSDSGYIAFDMSYKADTKARTISNVPIEERIHLKKLNWLSLMYKMNDVTDDVEDKFGFPTTIKISNYYTTDGVVKLVALKKWLEKYVMGVNCRITDIGGEGVVFERYSLPKFGKYQQVFDYTNEKAISPVIVNDVEIMQDGSANITVNVSSTDYGITVEDCSGKTFADYCTGYFDFQNYYQLYDGELPDSSRNVYCGKTFELDDDINTFELRAKGTHDTFRFGRSYISPEYPTLLIDNDEIFIDPHFMDSSTSTYNATFEPDNSPIIRIEQGYIKRYNSVTENFGNPEYEAHIYKDDKADNDISYIVDVSTNGVSSSFTTTNYVDLMPPTLDDKNSDAVIILPSSYDSSYGNIKSKQVKIHKLRSKAYYFDISSIDASSAEYVHGKKTFNYGLRFTTNTPDGRPSFLILGYEYPSYYYEHANENKHFPELKMSDSSTPYVDDGYEYYLEILDGCMIFDDNKNNRKVSLNFSYDKDNDHVSINVTTFAYSIQSTSYKYEIDYNPGTGVSKYTNRFTPKTNYFHFVSKYVESAMPVIEHDSTKMVKVLNAGKYEIAALLYDEYNNVFAHKANKTVNVLTPDVDSSTFILGKTSNNEYNAIGSKISSTEIDYMNAQLPIKCEFKYAPKRQIYSYNRGDSSNISIDYHSDHNTSYHQNHIDGLYAQLTTLSERIDLVGKTKSENDSSNYFYSFVKRKFTNDSNNNKGYVTLSNINELKRFCNYNELDVFSTAQSPHEPLNYFNQIDNSTGMTMTGRLLETSCYLVCYSPSSESVIYCVPGEMIPTLNWNVGKYNNTKYDEFIFEPDIIHRDEINNLMENALTSFEYEYYMIPTWIAKITNYSLDSSTKKLNIKSEKYPFLRTPANDGLIKILYASKYPEIWRDGLPIFGQASYHQIDSSIDSSIFCCTLDGTLNESYRDASLNPTVFINVSQGCGEFVEFIKEISSLSDPTNSNIVLPKTNSNKEFMKYIDTTYAVSVRDFNINDAKEIMAPFNKAATSITREIFSRLCGYNVPIRMDDKTTRLAVITTNLSRAYPHFKGPRNLNDPICILDFKGCTPRWRVYHRTGKSNRKLILDVYNAMIHLIISKKGDYDVQLDVYDENGNKYSKFLNGAISYK